MKAHTGKKKPSKMHCAQSHSDELFIELMIQLGEHFSFSGVKFHASRNKALKIVMGAIIFRICQIITSFFNNELIR